MLFRSPHLSVLGVGLAALGLGAVGARAVTPISTERASLSTSEFQGNGDSVGPVTLSTDGRFATFTSAADNFYVRDNTFADVFLRDRQSGITEMISVAQPAVPGPYVLANGASRNGSVSGDGRYVAYETDATNTLAGDGNNATDVYLRDRFGAIKRLSVAPDGASGDGASRNPRISANGRFVVFESAAKNLVTGDTNDNIDVFVRDLQFNTTRRVSTSTGGGQVDGDSTIGSISDDGRYVAFQSNAAGVVSGVGDGTQVHVYVKDLATNDVVLASADEAGDAGDGDSTLPTISADGSAVAFISDSTNLDPADGNGVSDVFVKSLLDDTVVRASVSSDGTEGDADSGVSSSFGALTARPSISDDGRFVAYTSQATNLDFGDDNGLEDVFLHDVSDGSTARVSVGTGLIQATGASASAGLSGDGVLVGFASDAENLVGDDFNGSSDVFVAEVSATTGDNGAPFADAGFDLFVAEGDQVTLDGGASDDPDGDFLTYQWTQLFDGEEAGADPTDPVVTLDDPTGIFPSFTAPFVSDFEDVVFQLTVSDGINPPVTDTVVIEIDATLDQTLSGSVVDSEGNSIAGATVRLVRDADGFESDEVTTDDFGVFVIENARVGDSTLFVSFPGYETATQSLTIFPNEDAVQDVVLEERTATLRGTLFLANGQAVPGADIQLLDGEGNILAEDTTDDGGEYRLDSLQRSDVESATTIKIFRPKSDTPWTISNIFLNAGEDNVRDFQYGNLKVTLKAGKGVTAAQIKGTTLEVLIGEQLLASNTVRGNTRVFTFNNVPSTLLRVRAHTRNKLTGQQLEVEVQPGRGPAKVTLTLKKRGIF